MLRDGRGASLWKPVWVYECVRVFFGHSDKKQTAAWSALWKGKSQVIGAEDEVIVHKREKNVWPERVVQLFPTPRALPDPQKNKPDFTCA